MLETEGAVSFEVRLLPRAPRTQIAGQQAGAIKLRVKAPPVDGKANDECVRFFAELVGAPRRSVSIVKGHRSRSKVVRISGVSTERVRKALGIL